MNAHHLIAETIQCLYCGEDSHGREWFSEWVREHHYKCFNCPECGKKNFIRVKFSGSGQDNSLELERRIA